MRTEKKSAWFALPHGDMLDGIDRTAALIAVEPTSKKIRWALARFADAGIVGPFDSAELAFAAGDDASRCCSRCCGGRGRHVCPECQASILPAVLVASVAVGGAR